MIAPDTDKSLLKRLHGIEQAREVPNDENHPRMFRRFVVRGDALLHPMNRSRLDATPVDVKLRDISRNGIGFICNQPLPINSCWRIELQLAGYAIGSQALVVRHVREVGDGMFLCGANFVIDTALLALLGVEPSLLEEPEDAGQPNVPDDHFVAPGEVG
ncbi:MAG: PilZ domain-containing protein [Phycisphaeraceae bacterium]|nr:PilZ domain-containing protein [Phycisphaeraceae bacterium]